MKKLILTLLIPFLFLAAAAAQRGGPPRRIENPSTIDLEGGSVVEFLAFHSPSVGGSVEYSVFLPPSYQDSNQAFPVIYFLHGLFNDHTSWAVDRYGNIPRQIEQMISRKEIPSAILVFPNGQNSFYTDQLDGTRKFEQFLISDLITEIEEKFRTKEEGQYRAIGGVSMGGYGALKAAMKNPGLYSSVAAVSPIVFLGDDPSSSIRGSDSRMAQFLVRIFEPIFGIPFDTNHWRENSLENLARTADLGDLNIYFAYGTADRYNDAFPMQQGVETLDAILRERGVSHTYRAYPGEPHGWELVSSHLKEIFGFLTQTF